MDTPQLYLDIAEIFFGSIKTLIVLLQIFLIFIRPCLPSTNSHTIEKVLGDAETTTGLKNHSPSPESRWTAWASSTLLSLQFLLALGFL